MFVEHGCHVRGGPEYEDDQGLFLERRGEGAGCLILDSEILATRGAFVDLQTLGPEACGDVQRFRVCNVERGVAKDSAHAADCELWGMEGLNQREPIVHL